MKWQGRRESQNVEDRRGRPGGMRAGGLGIGGLVLLLAISYHIQTLTGVSDRMAAARRSASETEANALSVRQELQADCYAGVWGHFAARKSLLDADDVEEGLRAAAAIGDDRLQKQSRGRVVPESFTHGSSAERVGWFKRGLETGRMDACNTSR